MFGDFLLWWRDELCALLPKWFVHRFLSGPPEVVLRLDEQRGDALVASLRDTRQVSALGRYRFDNEDMARLSALTNGRFAASRVALELVAGAFLDKELSVPRAARPHLDAYISSVLPDETPYMADEVLWRASIVTADRATGTMRVRLRMIRRSLAQPWILRLKAAGIGVSDLVPAADAPLVEGVAVAAARPRTSAAFNALAGACAGLALTILLLPFVWQSLALDAVEARIDAIHEDYDAASALRRRLDGTPASLADGTLSPLRVLAALTDALPDDTTLVSLSLQDRALTMAGRSSAATLVLGRLARSAAFRDPSYISAITRDPKTGLSSFSIKTEVRP